MRMSFSASVLPGSTHAPWSVTHTSHLGAYHWDVGKDVYIHMRAYVYREMYVFLLSLLALFVNQRENKQLIKIKSPENSNRLVRVGKQKPVVAGGIDSHAISSPISTFPRL